MVVCILYQTHFSIKKQIAETTKAQYTRLANQPVVWAVVRKDGSGLDEVDGVGDGNHRERRDDDVITRTNL